MGATIEFIIPPALLDDIKFTRLGSSFVMQLNLKKYGIDRTFEVTQLDAFLEPINAFAPEHINHFYASTWTLSNNAKGLVDQINALGIPAATDTISEDIDGCFRIAFQNITDVDGETYPVPTNQQGLLNHHTGEEITDQGILIKQLDARWW